MSPDGSSLKAFRFPLPAHQDVFIDGFFSSLKILPRVLRDVSTVDTSVVFFNHTYAVPFGIAPSAMQKLAGGEGETDVARASANLGINMTLSSQSTASLEEVMSSRCRLDAPAGQKRTSPDGDGGRRGLDPAFWMQLYLTEDPERSLPLIRRAEGKFSPLSVPAGRAVFRLWGRSGLLTEHSVHRRRLRSPGYNCRHSRPREPPERTQSTAHSSSTSSPRQHRAGRVHIHPTSRLRAKAHVQPSLDGCTDSGNSRVHPQAGRRKHAQQFLDVGHNNPVFEESGTKDENNPQGDHDP